MAGVTEVIVDDIEQLLEKYTADSSVDTSYRKRLPFIMTRESWLTADYAGTGDIDVAAIRAAAERESSMGLVSGSYIVANINPSEVSFRLALRSTEQKVRGGTVTHTWFDRTRGTFFDEPVLSFTFQSGNCMPVRMENGELSMPRGLNAFHSFMNLLDTENTLPDGRPNYVYIIYNSLKFPTLTLVGFFAPGGISFTDSSQSASEMSWSADFICHFTSPKLTSSTELRQRFVEVHTELGTVR